MKIKLNDSSFILEKDNTEIDVFEKLNNNTPDNVAILGENIPDNYVVGEDNNAYRVLPDHNIVPVSHPDLSTQPSILPYRFGATPVYEVLIANGRENEIPKDAVVIEAFSFNKDACVPAVVEKVDEGWSIHNSESIVPDFTLIKHIGKTDDYYYQQKNKEKYFDLIIKDSNLKKFLSVENIIHDGTAQREDVSYSNERFNINLETNNFGITFSIVGRIPPEYDVAVLCRGINTDIDHTSGNNNYYWIKFMDFIGDYYTEIELPNDVSYEGYVYCQPILIKNINNICCLDQTDNYNANIIKCRVERGYIDNITYVSNNDLNNEFKD